MKKLIGLVVLSLSMVGCAVEPAPEVADETTSSTAELTSSADETATGNSPWGRLEATTQGCDPPFFSCVVSCPLNGQRNVLVQMCDGVEIVIFEFPCSPEGCF